MSLKSILKYILSAVFFSIITLVIINLPLFDESPLEDAPFDPQLDPALKSSNNAFYFRLGLFSAPKEDPLLAGKKWTLHFNKTPITWDSNVKPELAKYLNQQKEALRLLNSYIDCDVLSKQECLDQLSKKQPDKQIELWIDRYHQLLDFDAYGFALRPTLVGLPTSALESLHRAALVSSLTPSTERSSKIANQINRDLRFWRMVLLRSHNLDDKHFAGRMLQQTYRFARQVLAGDTSHDELKGLLDPTMFQPIAKKLFVKKTANKALSSYENSIRYELAAYSATLNRGDMENVRDQVYAETSYPFRLCGTVSSLLIQPQATQNLLVRISLLETENINQIMEEITDSLVIGQDWDNDVRVILFVKLASGVELDDDLATRIKRTIRSNCTPRHVPAKIIPVADIPYTISGKKVELAVRRVIHGLEVHNRDALKNPEALDLYVDLAELRE